MTGVTSSCPCVEVGPERLALAPDDAETVPGRSLHDPPALAERDPAGAEGLQPGRLGLEVVGFDVEVDARGVVDLLQQDQRLVRGGRELGVLAVAVLVGAGDRLAERATPERGRGREI